MRPLIKYENAISTWKILGVSKAFKLDLVDEDENQYSASKKSVLFFANKENSNGENNSIIVDFFNRGLDPLNESDLNQQKDISNIKMDEELYVYLGNKKENNKVQEKDSNFYQNYKKQTSNKFLEEEEKDSNFYQNYKKQNSNKFLEEESNSFINQKKEKLNIKLDEDSEEETEHMYKRKIFNGEKKAETFKSCLFEFDMFNKQNESKNNINQMDGANNTYFLHENDKDNSKNDEALKFYNESLEQIKLNQNFTISSFGRKSGAKRIMN